MRREVGSASINAFPLRLETLLKSLIPELTLMEAYSRALPAWQVRNYEVPSWSLTENPSFLEGITFTAFYY